MEKRFVYASEDTRAHWEACRKNGWPYVAIHRTGREYSELFCDITDLKHADMALYDAIKDIYGAYARFFLIPYTEIDYLYDNACFHTLKVLNAHAECLAEALHAYIMSETRNRRAP